MASASRSRSSSSVAEVIAATCPAVRVNILPDCGHAVPIEAPGPLYREVVTLVAAAGRDEARDRTKPRYRRENAFWGFHLLGGGRSCWMGRREAWQGRAAAWV